MYGRELALSNLEMLARGMVIILDHVPSYIRNGWVKREEVLPYLKQSLETVIPYYRRSVVSAPEYSRRLEEAEQAIVAIKEGKPVTFGGIKL